MMADDLAPIYFRVSPAIWRQRWTEPMRYLALYLLTCPHRTMEGLFVLPKPYVCADLKWSPESLAEPFGELVADGFMDYSEDDEVCFICKALTYQPPRNPNMVKAAVRRIRTVPKTRLDEDFIHAACAYAESLAESLRQSLPERFANGSPNHRANPSSYPALPNSALSAGGREASPSAPPARAERDGNMDVCPICHKNGIGIAVSFDGDSAHCATCGWQGQGAA